MTDVLLTTGLRPFSKWCVEPIDFSRSVDVATKPVIDGEETGSGTQSPIVHILDSFFERCYQPSRLSQIARKGMSSSPRLHRHLIEAVTEVSVLDYIQSLKPSVKRQQLLHLYMTALGSFAGDTGFLGKHHFRLIAFIELGTKIGRDKTASLLALTSWKGRIWYRIDANLEEVRRERMYRCRTLYHPISVRSSTPEGENSPFAHRIVSDTDGTMCYKPGDILCIMPENRNALVNQVLNALKIDRSRIVEVGTEVWRQNLWNRGFENDFTENCTVSTIRITPLPQHRDVAPTAE